MKVNHEVCHDNILTSQLDRNVLTWAMVFLNYLSAGQIHTQCFVNDMKKWWDIDIAIKATFHNLPSHQMRIYDIKHKPLRREYRITWRMRERKREIDGERECFSVLIFLHTHQINEEGINVWSHLIWYCHSL